MAVALCTFNGASFLRAQLESIAAQERAPDLLLVVDDASSDDSAEIAREFGRGAAFPVRVVVNEHTLGFAANFGRAIGLAGGDVVVLCDQDDVWHPAKLARMEAAFERAPEAGVVFSDAELVDAELAPLGERLWDAVGLTPARRQALSEGRGFDHLVGRTLVTGATMAFRASFRDLVLPVPAGVEHDAWIALLVSAVAGIEPIAEPLVLYRQHGGNAIGARRVGLVRRAGRARAVRAKGLRARHARNAAALERLTAWGADAALLKTLRDSVEHLQVRMELAGHARTHRLREVAGELARRRYARYSEGVSSALRDLWA
ncbi:MAG TPA: glycosyltransferase family 2 protein [Longimicrobium sp.]|jgi:glycosyltransferase involved in cell wall biosynthesis